MLNDELLAEFDARAAALRSVAADGEARLRELLVAERIGFHSISARLKSRESLRAKLARPDKTYRSLWDVTDLVGLRITTYFEDSLEKISAMLERHFKVSFHQSVDRLRPEGSGYRSLHVVCEWPGALPSEFRLEIQLRTILQHAWAEIEHDLGYKAGDTIPESVRHRFNRLAGLLEIADEEFVSIRADLASYESSIGDGSRAFPLDRVSLRSITGSAESRALDLRISEALGRPLGTELFLPEYLLKMLRLAGFRTTVDLRADLARNAGRALEIVAPYFVFTGKTWKLKASDLDAIPVGYGLFFLSHVAVLRSEILDPNKVTKLAQFYRELDYPDDEPSARRVAAGLLEALAPYSR